MNLPSVKKLKISQKNVLLRTDYDVPLTSDGQVADESRIKDSLSTINYLLARKAAVIIIAHLDRPGGRPVPGLSLNPVVERLQMKLPKVKIKFTQEISGEKTKRMVANLKAGEVLVLENLRFDPGEIKNDSQFAKTLAGLAEAYVNNAFAASHREHASIAKMPRFLPAGFGLDFLEEVRVLTKVRNKPKHPVVLILGGKKKSKIEIAKAMTNIADFILVGGELVEYEGVSEIVSRHQKIIGSLTKHGEDITPQTAGEFKKIIAQAKTIIWSGPMGVFEEKKFASGTREIALAVAKSRAYSVVGGGETEAALTKFGVVDKIDYISSGGGAMLAFLAAGTLPGIEAVLKKGG